MKRQWKRLQGLCQDVGGNLHESATQEWNNIYDLKTV